VLLIVARSETAPYAFGTPKWHNGYRIFYQCRKRLSTKRLRL